RDQIGEHCPRVRYHLLHLTLVPLCLRPGHLPATGLSFFLYMASIRAVTAKPPKILTLASATAARPSHLDVADPAAALAISAPTMITEEMALVTAISGVWRAGVTDQTT